VDENSINGTGPRALRAVDLLRKGEGTSRDGAEENGRGLLFVLLQSYLILLAASDDKEPAVDTATPEACCVLTIFLL